MIIISWILFSLVSMALVGAFIGMLSDTTVPYDYNDYDEEIEDVS